ncbi:MAG: LPXTG cell wall anchor domain-containing protein [Solirubrobacterales bacterium]
MRRSLRVALVAVLVLLAPASSAFAHGGNPNYRSVIKKVTPSIPNVKFQVLNYDSYMQLLDQHGHEVTIYGYEGEPYARILKNGTVQVNERSPALYLNENRFAEVTVPPIANAKAPPKWKTFDHSATFIWHDHRMHYMSPSIPPQVKDQSKKTKIFNYSIPIRVDNKKGAIKGTLYWVGPANTSKTPFIIAGIAIVVLGGAAVLFIRRRRRDEGDGGNAGSTPLEPAKEAW